MKPCICGYLNSASAKFCTNCGEPLVSICPKCNTALDVSAKFCSNCGNKIKELPKAPPQINTADFVIKGGNLKKYKGSSAEVIIPEGITSISAYAFEKCENITSIITPNTLQKIDEGAFWNCSSLTHITLGNGVTHISEPAFGGCTSIAYITVSDDNLAYTSIDGNLYTKDEKTLIKYAVGSASTSFSIPVGVKNIGVAAFSGCQSLTSITIPEGVLSISRSAFNECISLANITLPDTVTSIGDYAFCKCISLTEIMIPNKAKSIGKSAFTGCINLTNAVIGDSVIAIGDWAFDGCNRLASVKFNNTKGWKAYSTIITSKDLSNKKTAASYLKGSYRSLGWSRG